MSQECEPRQTKTCRHGTHVAREDEAEVITWEFMLGKDWAMASRWGCTRHTDITHCWIQDRACSSAVWTVENQTIEGRHDASQDIAPGQAQTWQHGTHTEWCQEMPISHVLTRT